MAVHCSNGVVLHQRVNKAFNKITFLQFLTGLIPQLPANTKAILMDNVAFHRSKVVTNLLEMHGLQPIYIPPYSPRCNPIEEVFSLVKRFFRTKTTSLDFIERVDESIDALNLYKDFTPFYKHTRQYVLMECHKLESSNEKLEVSSNEKI